ncbi:BatA domain-containing protein [Thalassoglobus polymorphus]|uniref:VWFA domain-containing protein n=1 Tax=Thalassoglobus polymorphus TaxID=2527994 RepID=A0A517QN91_9PLAN|nr:BatA domain-containing protein [Thalassoglobus polymorphus]QDT33075.1 hypothetical protein Mal48_23270 [Thalassoglobus polymorphus]
MSFLTPLYLLAGLAVGLPVLFHLIRRTPKGRQVFSSLMFLQPSPPRVTKRSRIEDWLLLILRALAVCLLAIAFARPFLRSQDSLDGEKAPGRRIVLLIDTSASMLRPKFWETALENVENVVDNLKQSDSLSLLSFNTEITQEISFKDWQALAPDVRKSAILEQVNQLAPGSFGTELGTAMLTAADLLDESVDEKVTEQKLMVISDFQTGSHWETLNGYEWPENVSVEILNVDKNESPTNASVQLIANESTTDDSVRLRVNNTTEAEQEQFKIAWLDEFSGTSKDSQSLDNSVSVYVPPGQSKVIRAPKRPSQVVPQRLVISGDQQDFDNTCYVARRDPWEVNIVYIGEDNATGPDSLRFFLQPVFPSTATRNVTIHDWAPDTDTPPVAGEKLTLLIIGGTPSKEQIDWSKKWLADGGQVLFVASTQKQSVGLYDLAELTAESPTEADVVDYTMLNSVDFTHPVLTPFDDPRFADFSKLRFWKHREFDLKNFSEHQVLASFENGSPAIFELKVGSGQLVVFASGWNRSDSDLAVWSKFVPMMNGLLEYLGGQRSFRPVYFAGNKITLQEFGFIEEKVVLKSPSGEISSLSNEEPLQLKHPGIYSIGTSEENLSSPDAVRFAVNLPPDESKTDPLSMDLLSAAGVPIKNVTSLSNSPSPDKVTERQLMNRELESKQQLWKWLLVAAICVLFFETALAGWKQRQPQPAT